MILDALTPDDTAAAMELSVAQGWNQTAADWRRVMILEPSGCFAAREGNRLIGTVTSTTYGWSLAWIGMMIVDPEFRRQGVGAALMNLALEYLRRRDVATVKLDATPEGRPLYESLGFSARAGIARWRGVVTTSGGSLPASNPEIDPLRTVLALDQRAYAADRSRLLHHLVADGIGPPLVARSSDGMPAGYALARRGRMSSYVGPVVATTSAAAAHLLEAMFGRLAGEDVCIDLHDAGSIHPDALATRGLSIQRSLTRMSLGAQDRAGTPRSVCASAGPELG